MESNNKWTFFAPFLVIGAGICWGIIGLFSRQLSTAGLSSIQVTATRNIVAGTVIFLFLLLFDRGKLKIHLKDIWMFLGTGIVSIVFFNICYFYCITQTSLSIACILLYTAPCFVMIMSCIFFKEKFSIKKGLALVLSMIGCIFITGIIGGADSSTLSMLGLLSGIGSGLGYAMYSIFGRVALGHYSPVTVTVYTFLVAAISLIPFANIRQIAAITTSTPRLALCTVLLGLISTLLPFCLYTKGLEHMETGRASILTFAEPMVATLAGIIVFHEPFTLLMGVGMVLIVLSIALLNGKQR